jgi:SAM-dependent methyltransferase
MDARKLEFEDESFDAVVSFSSIEHFGGPSGISAAAREIGRVLRPGGHAFLVTELFVSQHPIDHTPALFAVRLATLGRRCGQATPRWGPTEVFNQRQLRKWVLEPSGLELMQPLDLRLSETSKRNVHWIEPDGTVASSTGAPYPHILLRAHRSTFTSICLPLVKP